MQALQAGMNAGPGNPLPLLANGQIPPNAPLQPDPNSNQALTTPDYLYTPAGGPSIHPPNISATQQSGFGPAGNAFPQQPTQSGFPSPATTLAPFPNQAPANGYHPGTQTPAGSVPNSGTEYSVHPGAGF